MTITENILVIAIAKCQRAKISGAVKPHTAFSPLLGPPAWHSRWINKRGKPVSQTPLTAEVSAKQSINQLQLQLQLHTTHVGAVAGETQSSSTSTCAGKVDHELPVNQSKGHTYTNPRPLHYLTHAHSRTISCRGESFKCQFHTIHVGALGWEPHGSSLEANKIFGAPLKSSELFSSKDTKHFAALLFCLAACNKKFQRANAQISRRMKMIHRLLVEEGMSTGHGSWILWSVSRVRSKTMHSLSCITIWLSYITLCYIDSSFFRPLEQSRTALLAAASQPRVFARLLVGNYWSRRLPSSPQLKAYYSRLMHRWSSRPVSKASQTCTLWGGGKLYLEKLGLHNTLAWVSISRQLFWWVWKESHFRVNFLCLDCCEGCRSFRNVLFFKSQVFLYFRAQVFELSEETQGVVTGVHGTHVRTWKMQG